MRIDVCYCDFDCSSNETYFKIGEVPLDAPENELPNFYFYVVGDLDDELLTDEVSVNITLRAFTDCVEKRISCVNSPCIRYASDAFVGNSSRGSHHPILCSSVHEQRFRREWCGDG